VPPRDSSPTAVSPKALAAARGAATGSWEPPETFDEYRLIELIGRGGMGDVYLAHDKILDRPVAVKFISAFEPDAVARERFLVEARAAARLQHSNVLTIYRVGELDDRPFIVSEFIHGVGLDHVDKPMSWQRALEIGKGLARGLAAAHRRGVLHRDIKPGNAILTDDGEVKLLDFGLAKFLDPSLVPDDQRRTSPPPLKYSTAPGRGPSSRRSGELPSPREVARTDTLQSALSEYAPAPDGDLRGEPEKSSLTEAGTLLGTPDYLAPEIWCGEPATRRSDVYSLGALIFELCAGHSPHREAPFSRLSYVVRQREAPRLIDLVPAVSPLLSAVVERCLRHDPAERFASGEELREALEQIELGPPRALVPEGNPYRGLHTFEAEHRALFFGRRLEISAVFERLRSDPLVLVAGDSGVGKSSLCRAGVLPHVAEGAFGDGRTWSVLPLVPGRYPLTTLAAALAPHLGKDEDVISERLRASPASLCRDLRKQQGDGYGLVIFIDQAEELITLADPAETALAGEALGHLGSGIPGVRILMTVRSDFLARVAAVPGVGDEISRGLYLLRPLSREGMREAIIGPSRAKGVTFESDALVSALIDSTASTEGGLPLLQFALAELWEARVKGRDGLITAAALEAIGGVSGALARHADNVLLALTPEQRRAARRILIALMTLEGTRTRRTEAELAGEDPAANAALYALVKGRLLVVRNTEQGATYELAHEALLKGWATLSRLLDKHEGTRAVRHRIDVAAGEWERLGRVPEALWSSRQLAEIGPSIEEDLSPREARFIEASRRAIRRGRIRHGALLAALPLSIGLMYGGLRIHAQRELDQRVGVLADEATALISEARRDAAAALDLRKRAFSHFDAFERDEGEALFAEALTLEEKADRSYGRASQALETTLMLDAGRSEVPRTLGDVLYERARLAERAHRPERIEELLQRLTLYDANGERRRRWAAPAQLTIESVPPEAHVTLYRFELGEHRARQLVQVRDLGTAPRFDLELEPDSYLFALSAEGRADVRYPVMLSRGEVLRLSVDLPPAAAVPEGFVYVPPGRFLFGSTADEEARRAFFNTVPLHQVETEGYLIARHETTYGEWITYLRALRPEERALRMPEVGGLTGSIELKELPGEHWQLTLKPTSRAYTAREGEMIAYELRQRRIVQDWRKFPVAGISLEDAEAYAAWLSSTGRVPGARLCTEREWERAARGADAREFPHGDRLEPDDANIDATYGKQALAFGPDEVGAHPASQSPFGIDDACGNVFEWTVSSLTPNENVLRGGAYYYDNTTVRSTNRQVAQPTARDPNIGIRLCATLRL
jgi:serine/threonine protein kinase/formylglycine-generating enzyme required for sulfatase activity